MTERLHVRVTKDGKTPNYELMFEGRKVGELSWMDLLQAVLQLTSALRWGKD